MSARVLVVLLPFLAACGPESTRLVVDADQDADDSRPDVAEVVIPPGGCVDELLYHESFDDRFDRRAELVRDARGRLVRYREYFGPEDVVVEDVVLRWDDAGRLVAEDEDDEGDGTLERTLEWSYDAEGRLSGVRSRSTLYESSTYDMTLTYGGLGRRLREDTDYDFDGLADEVRLYDWREGEPLELSVGLDAEPPDGVVDYGWRYAFRDGRWMTLLEGFNHDEVQSRERFESDAAGRLLRREFDLPVGDPVEDIDVHTRDAAGRIEQVEYLDGTDGHTFEIVRFERDPSGRLLRRIYEAPDPTYFAGVFEFEWDGEGRVAGMTQLSSEGTEEYCRWTVRRGCPGNPPLDELRRAPINDLSRRLVEEDFELDFNEWWDPVGPW